MAARLTRFSSLLLLKEADFFWAATGKDNKMEKNIRTDSFIRDAINVFSSVKSKKIADRTGPGNGKVNYKKNRNKLV